VYHTADSAALYLTQKANMFCTENSIGFELANAGICKICVTLNLQIHNTFTSQIYMAVGKIISGRCSQEGK
jgi:hypothetical protein